MPIRPARTSDRDAVYDVCLRTADAGSDATAIYSDPELPGNVWAGAYLALDPSLAFVLDDDEGVCGYVLGTADTEEFDIRCEREWWPRLRAIYADPVSITRDERTPEQHSARLIHRPRVTPSSITDHYPAHLHIDLLPRAQGHGNGRALLDHFENALRAQQSIGVHFGVSARNVHAHAFYRHLGYEPVAGDESGTIFARDLR